MGEYEDNRFFFLSCDDSFKKEIIKLREKWGIPPKGFLKGKEESDWSLKLLKSGKSEIFNQDFHRLLRKFNLSNYYRQRVHEYLFSNKVNDIKQVEQNNIRIFSRTDDADKRKLRLFVEIFSETSIEDLKKSWEKISQLKKDAIGFKENTRKRVNLMDRDKAIYSLYKEGKSPKEIKREIEGMPCTRNIELKYISKIIERMENKAKKFLGDN
ncbi:MAG: hypothetical protein ACOCUF_01155 [Patescibacteria group bacterium]